MIIQMNEITVKDIINGYEDNDENGVVAYGGKLNVRPAFQREFVYKDKQRDEVINTVRKGFPLNVMYWVKSENGFELMDGQQRTISLCQYISGDYSVGYQYFHNLTDSEKEAMLNYKLMVYICEGTDKEKLDWFKIINIAGVQLTDQELRNAVYTGTWLSDAKKRFSKKDCPAYNIAKSYMTGSPIRQDYLQTVLTWISKKEGIALEEYMARHQHDSNAGALWSYFVSIIEWVKSVFPDYMKEMKGVEWGELYNEYGNLFPDVAKTKAEITRLMADEDVTNKKGIFEYILSGCTKERVLSIRTFSDNMKREAYEKQNHKCPHCLTEGNDKEWGIDEMEGDHITPWNKGGRTVAENCQMLCKRHNREKGGK